MESSLTLSTSAYIDGHAGSLVHNRYPDGESQVGCNTKHAVAIAILWKVRRELQHSHAKQARTVLTDSIFIIEQSCSYNCSSNNLNCSYNYNSNNLSLITACKSQLVSM